MLVIVFPGMMVLLWLCSCYSWRCFEFTTATMYVVYIDKRGGQRIQDTRRISRADAVLMTTRGISNICCHLSIWTATDCTLVAGHRSILGSSQPNFHSPGPVQHRSTLLLLLLLLRVLYSPLASGRLTAEPVVPAI